MLRFDRVDKRITITKLLPFVLIWLLIPLITQTYSVSGSNPDYLFEFGNSAQQLPLAFVPHERFLDTPAGFSVSGLGSRLFFSQEGVAFSLAHSPVQGERLPALAESLHLQFAGANPYPIIEGIDPLAGTITDFIGNDPPQWQTDLPTFAGITYFDLYPGIDLYFTGPQGRLKSTYVVAPGVDPTRIVWRYAGADDVQIDAQTGDLVVTLTLDETGDTYQLRQQAPVAWQEIHGKPAPVEVGYVVTDERVTFSLGAYNGAYGLIIDRSYAGQ